VHISTEEAVFGGGIWLPPGDELHKIRNTIVGNPHAWGQIKTSRTVKKYFGGIGGEGLKRPPRGFDAEHEHIEDLKRKSFFLMRREPPERLCARGRENLQSRDAADGIHRLRAGYRDLKPPVRARAGAAYGPRWQKEANSRCDQIIFF
jgi:uncharacterized protein (DUF2461 family)